MRNCYTLLILIIFILQSCGGEGRSDLMQIIAERDSLREDNATKAEALSRYTETIGVINATLDSIAVQDDLLFIGSGELPVTRDQVLSNLQRFESILEQQQNKINQLERALAASKDSTNASLTLIHHLKEQIEIKNIQINQLKEEIANKNISIENLQQQVESQRLRIQTQDLAINELTKQNQRQGEALSRQDAMLNNGYVIIGTKDDLQRKGIIKKGKIVADAALDRSKFVKVDIRTWREINFNAKKPKILTNMPASSYQLMTNGNKNFTLTVTNPSDFWRISNYLVIQTD